MFASRGFSFSGLLEFSFCGVPGASFASIPDVWGRSWPSLCTSVVPFGLRQASLLDNVGSPLLPSLWSMSHFYVKNSIVLSKRKSFRSPRSMHLSCTGTRIYQFKSSLAELSRPSGRILSWNGQIPEWFNDPHVTYEVGGRVGIHSINYLEDTLALQHPLPP